MVVLRNVGKNATATNDTVVSQQKEAKVIVSPTVKETPKHMGSVLPQTGETESTTSVGYVLALLASILGFFGLSKPKKD